MENEVKLILSSHSTEKALRQWLTPNMRPASITLLPKGTKTSWKNVRNQSETDKVQDEPVTFKHLGKKGDHQRILEANWTVSHC